MRACVLHSAKDLRIEERPEAPLAAHEVRVRVRAGGICGSDLHYFFHGRVGDFVIREPLVPGHEFAGEVTEIGTGVTRLRPGQRVCVNPARNCGTCPRCREGRPNLCENVFFMGSASKFPHMHGGFAEFTTVAESQCFAVSGELPFEEMAFAEPLSVALHAALRGGNLMGRKVLVTGAGPIGQLVMLAARRGGAAHLAITDMINQPLQAARNMGADESFNVSGGTEALLEASRRIGGFDVVFEASGASPALNAGLLAVRAGGIVVQVGSLPGGETPVMANRIMAREIDLRGAFRFGEVFGDAVACLEKRLIDVRPLLTGTYTMDTASQAFAAAQDRTRNLKVVITF
ncbi:L-idonate 5-dehydrogenase [Pseudoroseomonas globiformis]|uniref:L-idonate 5-dehydrogenase n=1 Tax=Teichococcus globiformis TaxID=2307229 RepID=A0ABV7FX05_9PROT